MRNTQVWRWAFLASVFSLALGLWRLGGQSAAAERPAAAPACCAATIDLNGVLEALEERKSREKELQAFIGELEKKVNDLGKLGQQAQDDLKVLPKGGKEWEKKRDELVELNFRFKFESEFSKAKAENRRKLMHLELFQKIKDAAAKYAKAQGVAIVISSDSEVDIPENAPENQVQAAIVSRRIIHADRSVDISDAVSLQMNNEFKAR